MQEKKYLRQKAEKLCLIGEIVIESFWNIDRTIIIHVAGEPVICNYYNLYIMSKSSCLKVLRFTSLSIYKYIYL